MKTLKVMGIVGIVLAVITFICLAMYNNRYEYTTAIGWAVYSVLYLIAYCIVGIVQSHKYFNANK